MIKSSLPLFLTHNSRIDFELQSFEAYNHLGYNTWSATTMSNSKGRHAFLVLPARV